MSLLYSDALLKLHQGYTDQALQLADKGYRESQGSEAAWNWKFRVLKAEALLQRDRPQDGLSLLAHEPAEPIPVETKIRRRMLQSRSLCSLGQRAAGNSILLQEQPLIPPQERGLAAELLYAQAGCNLATNRPEALRYYREAAELAAGRDAFVQASALLGVGYVLLGDEAFDTAVDSLHQALALTDYPAIQERALGNLGYGYSQLGDYRRAIGYSKDAAKIAADLHRPDHEEKWLLDLGREYEALPGLYPGEAERQYTRALSIATELHDRHTMGRCLHNLTQLVLESHDLERAEEYWRRERQLILDGGENPSVDQESNAIFDEAAIALARRDYSSAERLYKSLLLNPKQDIPRRALAQRLLATAFWEQGKTAKADVSFREGIKIAEDALAKIRPEYRASFLDEDPFFDSYVRFLVDSERSVEALQLVEHARGLAQMGVDNEHAGSALNLQRLQRLLKAQRQIVLNYQVTDDETLLWVITSRECKIFHLPRHGEFFAEIGAYNKEIQDHREGLGSATGQKLFADLIQPATNLIPKGSNVTIVPSRLLYGLNFETLVVPGPDPHYWIDDVEIQISSSLAAAINQRAPTQRKPTKDLLQIGAPLEASKDFPVLKYAREEVDTIAKRFSVRARTITGKSATPQAYLSSSPQDYRLIQFVTHGTASETAPLESAIILSQQADNSYKLYARDIVKMPLHADLVTISACYGAGTRWYQNEGLVGLAWAFLHSGAHQVVAGLWEVDDAATPQLMDHFYEGLQEGKSAAAALRSAKLKMLHSDTVYKHPFYWASLQLYTGR